MKKLAFIITLTALPIFPAIAEEPVFTAAEAQALYRLGYAEGATQAQMKPIQEAAKSAIDKINKVDPKPDMSTK